LTNQIAPFFGTKEKKNKKRKDETMGTRGVVGVKVNGEYKVTYNHFDSYPDCLGEEVVALCNSLSDKGLWMKFKEMMQQVELVNSDDTPSKEVQDAYITEGFFDGMVSRQTPSEWYCLLRNLQGTEIFHAILDGKCKHMINSFDFLKDSLFCEYAYIINLDALSLEFYEGFNEEPDKNSPLPFEQKTYDRQSKYYPVKFKGACPVNKIPKNWKKKFF